MDLTNNAIFLSSELCSNHQLYIKITVDTSNNKQILNRFTKNNHAYLVYVEYTTNSQFVINEKIMSVRPNNVIHYHGLDGKRFSDGSWKVWRAFYWMKHDFPDLF